MPKLEAGDLFVMPGDDKPGRTWLVEYVNPGGASVRPFTKKSVDFEANGTGEGVHFEALDGRRTQISAHSDVEVIEKGVKFRAPRWRRISEKRNRSRAGL